MDPNQKEIEINANTKKKPICVSSALTTVVVYYVHVSAIK